MLRLIVAWIMFELAVLALQEVPRGHGFLTLVGTVAMIASLPLLLAAAERRRLPPPPIASTFLKGAVALFAVAQTVFAIVRTVKPKVLDIATTTAAAIVALVHGGNPYALPIDPLAGGIGGAAAAYHGYKYLPAMMLTYAPLALAMGVRGMVITNMLLQGATAACIGALAMRGGKIAALLGALLYLSLPFAAHQVFTRGINDLGAVLPLMIAILLLERRPTAAGLCVGFSIAAKLMPGLAVLPCLIPARGARARFAAGVALGLTPILPFVLASPGAFADNILLFNLMRPVDDTSWLVLLPGWMPLAARTISAMALVGLYAAIWRRPPGLDGRTAAAALAILLVFAVGPDMHHNYYFWFIPFFATLAARAAVGAIPAPAAR